jgi:predicted 3-demethylubiquinone-9 3-methyltransferase (glyoxalase superfamily)
MFKEKSRMAKSFTPFLMFEGVAEKAINFYVSLFKNGEIKEIERYNSGEQSAEGTVKKAEFILGGQKFICIDSPAKHNFTFTPSISIFVDCEDESELENAFKQLSESGEVLMPLNNYGFSSKFGWVNDRFGVSWQLNLQ